MSAGLREIPPIIHRAGRAALTVGVLGSVACLVGALLTPDQFFRSYLWSYVFWTGIAAGCLAVAMLQHVTGGRWGVVTRRLLESGSRTLPLMALLFLPLLLGMDQLYEWARPEAVAHDALLAHKAPYLNVPFFLLRTAFYFAVWMTMAWFLNRWSLEQDETGEEGLAVRMRGLSGAGIAIFILTMTFASVDWLMSLEPHWFSTIYGAMVILGQVLGAFALVVAVAVLLARYRPMGRVMGPDRLHDLGKLLFAFVMVWAYLAFSQFLIIWAGNLPEEIPWYLRRMQGGWQWLALAVVVLHFVLPFVVLLSRRTKRDPAVLGRVALLLVAMRLLDTFWLAAPGAGEVALAVHWLDLAAPAGLGGIWLWAYFRQLARRPLLPLRDPRLEEVLEHAG